MRPTALLACCLLGHVLSAAAEPTTVDVYVLSRDAKFVGSGVGGARITIRNASTGEVLAQGVTEGGTGDTDIIMGARKRDTRIVDADTAAFSATFDLEQPTRVQVSAYGPLDYPASANEVTAEQWLLPGKASGEQGWILDLPGLIVDVHDTPTLVKLSDAEPAALRVRATVRMMCGCPLTPDGLWNSNEFDIEARVMQGDDEVTREALRFAGEASEFEGTLQLAVPGEYRLEVLASQPRTGNAGVFEQPLIVD